MVDDRQLAFEDSVVLESSLVRHTAHGRTIQSSLDEISDRIKTLADVQSDTTGNIDWQAHKCLYYIVLDRFTLLTPRQREIAEMRYLKNMSYKQIAKAINVASLNAVAFHMRKIERILRR